jgi:hypothetical protein
LRVKVFDQRPPIPRMSKPLLAPSSSVNEPSLLRCLAITKVILADLVEYLLVCAYHAPAMISRDLLNSESVHLANMVARLRLIPDDSREFSIGAKRAALEFGIDEMLARDLIALGLPHTEVDGRLGFAAGDLHYVALRVGCASAYVEATRRWAAALTASSEHAWADVEVQCVPYAAPGSDVEILTPSSETLRVCIGTDRVAATFNMSMPGSWPEIELSLHEILAEIASLDFCWMPELMGADVDFARRTRLADCATAAKLLVEECRSRGVAARTAHGLLLSSPYSTLHNWAEIQTEGGWVPADPLLLALLVDYAGLDGEEWPPWRSPGAILVRLSECPTPVVRAGDSPLQATFLTRCHADRRMRGVSPTSASGTGDG